MVENVKTEKGTVSNNVANSLDPFDYHNLKGGENEFTELDYEQTHTYYADEGENREYEEDPSTIMKYDNGNNEKLKLFK